MASVRGRKPLVCFYCGFRSGKKFDGVLRQWECRRCEAVNYLDEHGDITDPPVSSTNAAPAVQYARALPRSISGPVTTSGADDASVFCATCLKNQHLFTACLAQYVPEEEDADAQPLTHEYYDFRRRLEERYPQVCADCEPRVVAQMKQAGYTAKTDHLRRVMQQTRRRRVAEQQTTTQFALLDLVQATGRVLWLLGWLGQFLWHVSFLADDLGSRLPGVVVSCWQPVAWAWAYMPWSGRVAALWRAYFEASPAICHGAPVQARWSLLLSVLSLFWNPKFKEAFRGFTRHITGWRLWYSYQMLALGVRCFFWAMRGSKVLTEHAGPARAAHLFMLCFLFYVGSSVVSLLTRQTLVASRRSIQINTTPLFAPTPEKLRSSAPTTKQATRSPSNMFDALDDILHATPTPGGTVGTTPTTAPSPVRRPSPLPVLGRQRTAPSLDLELPSRTTPSLLQMHPTEALHYMRTGEVPMDETAAADSDSMDWTPTHPNHRAFQPASSPRRGRATRSFNGAPVVPEQESSPFWYKVPPAPVGPAQKLRNPPNQARLHVSHPVAKENFFQSLRSDGGWASGAREGSPGRHAAQVEFAAPRFFPPNADDATGAELTAIFDRSFSLKSADDEETAPTSTTHEVVQTVGGWPLAAFLVLFAGIATAIVFKGATAYRASESL